MSLIPRIRELKENSSSEEIIKKINQIITLHNSIVRHTPYID